MNKPTLSSIAREIFGVPFNMLLEDEQREVRWYLEDMQTNNA